MVAIESLFVNELHQIPDRPEDVSLGLTFELREVEQGSWWDDNFYKELFLPLGSSFDFTAPAPKILTNRSEGRGPSVH